MNLFQAYRQQPGENPSENDPARLHDLCLHVLGRDRRQPQLGRARQVRPDRRRRREESEPALTRGRRPRRCDCGGHRPRVRAS